MSIVFFNLAIIAAILYGFNFFFDPYRKLPMNGIVRGRMYTWGHLVTTNKYGFREREFETPKPKGIYRVAVIGDSLTYGAGLAVEERYTVIAEKLLNKNFSDRKIEILNFGFSGGPTVRERDIVKSDDFKRIVDPDLIVVGFCLNDPQPRSQDYSIEKEKLHTTAVSYYVVSSISQGLQHIGLRYISSLTNDLYFNLAERIGVIPN